MNKVLMLMMVSLMLMVGACGPAESEKVDVVGDTSPDVEVMDGSDSEATVDTVDAGSDVTKTDASSVDVATDATKTDN